MIFRRGLALGAMSLMVWSFQVSAATTPDKDAFGLAISAAKAAMLSDPIDAVKKARVAEHVALSQPSRDRATRIATAEWLQSEAWVRLKKPSLAAPLVDAALRRIAGVAEAASLQGDLLLSKGWQASESGQTAQALGSYQNAHQIFLKIHDDRSRARALIAIAVIYDEAFDHENAIKYFRQALEAYRGDPNIAYSIYSNIGQTLKELKRYNEAEDQTRHALTLAQEMKSRALVGHTLRNLARIELFVGQLAQADRDLVRAAKSIDASDEEYAALLGTAAQAALQHGRIGQATALITRSFVGVDPEHTPLGMRERHETAYDVYRAAGDSADALVHLAAMKRLDDEATRLATSTNIALMGARFDFANQELRIAKLKADEAARTLAYERARARAQQWVFVGVIAATAVAIALLSMGLRKLRRSRNEVARANVVLGETNDALGRALAAKTEFLATTSHEIRTPLNGILGMTQVMLADQAVDPVVRERIGIVHTAGVTMRALVDDILDVAKMENGHLSVEAAPLDLCATLGELVKLWREQAQAKGLTFEADLRDCPARIEGDAARLRQIVFNLLGNAIKFTQAGTVSLRAWRVEDPAQGEPPRYRVAVADSGIGIAADKYELIFESFRQGDTSTTRQYGGTGLGLAISRRLARAMGGDVIVTSEPGAGSVFTLDLPLVEAPAPAETAAEPVAAAMLVVERNPIARGMYKALLAPHFGEVAFAGSTAEAVALLARGGAARVLADDATLRLGQPLADAVAAIAASGVPLALLWSPVADEDAGQLKASGAQQLLRKPITRSEMVAALTGNMDHSSADLECRAA